MLPKWIAKTCMTDYNIVANFVITLIDFIQWSCALLILSVLGDGY